MDRLTWEYEDTNGAYFMQCTMGCAMEQTSCEDCPELDKMVDRLGAIEDILGETYDLEQLSKLVKASREHRVIVLDPGYRITKTEGINEEIDCMEYERA